MKITEEKHNHKLTNLLKVFIFSILMLLPFLNVAVRCGYVMLNKNAYQSAEITQTTYNRTPKYTQGDINNGLEVDKIYHMNCSNRSIDEFIQATNEYFYFSFQILNIQSYDFSNYNINLDDLIKDSSMNLFAHPSYPVIETTVENTYFYFYLIRNDYDYFANFSTDTLENGTFTLICDFKVIGWQNGVIPEFQDVITNTTYQDYIYNEVESTTLDNVFEYSLSKLKEEEYLNWTQNTAVYQGVESMTTGLGITQTVIPMLIVYWFILTIIYVIIDIVIALFTKLTHMIGNKTT